MTPNSSKTDEPKEYEIPVKIKDKNNSNADGQTTIKDAGVEEGEVTKTPSPQKPEAAASQKEEEEMTVECKDEKIARLEEQVKRLSAEFENFRRRQEKRYDEAVKYAAENVLCEFLPVLDSIRMAHNSAVREHDFDQLLKGLEMIASQLQDTLMKVGVEEIKAEGREFDPAYHHAVLAEETDEYPDQHVIEELQKGYKYKDRILRPSMVKVARNPE